jgi:hypothetical protein
VHIPGTPSTVTSTVYQGPAARVVTLVDDAGGHSWPSWYLPIALHALLNR